MWRVCSTCFQFLVVKIKKNVEILVISHLAQPFLYFLKKNPSINLKIEEIENHDLKNTFRLRYRKLLEQPNIRGHINLLQSLFSTLSPTHDMTIIIKAFYSKQFSSFEALKKVTMTMDTEHFVHSFRHSQLLGAVDVSTVILFS